MKLLIHYMYVKYFLFFNKPVTVQKPGENDKEGKPFVGGFKPVGRLYGNIRIFVCMIGRGKQSCFGQINLISL
ncbi:hypothetical protein GCM10027299_55360 [Larkinella ripae]